MTACPSRAFAAQNVLYRPSCAECAACLSARIRVADFAPSRSQRTHPPPQCRLERRATSPWATEDQYDLFRRYLDSRHADGGMADMDVFEFAAMIEETPIRTRVIEYHDTGAEPRTLAAVCLTDVWMTGSAWSIPSTSPTGRATAWAPISSLTISASRARRVCPMSIWAIGCPAAQDGLQGQVSPAGALQGRPVAGCGDPADYRAELHPLSTDPIAEQVANISLPGAVPARS
jgi:leucyl-tRNA---protein transferase